MPIGDWHWAGIALAADQAQDKQRSAAILAPSAHLVQMIGTT